MTGKADPWHLDKRVPVALIFAIFAQTGTAFSLVGDAMVGLVAHDDFFGVVRSGTSDRGAVKAA